MITYWSSVESGAFLTGVIKELALLETPSVHRFNVSNRTYRSSSSSFQRILLRVRMYIIYPVHLFFAELFRPSSICIVNTNTFYAVWFAGLAHRLRGLVDRKSRKVVYLVYDLFPEALIHSQKYKVKSLLMKVIRSVVRSSMVRADHIVVLVDSLKNYVAEQYPEIEKKLSVIEVGADTSLWQSQRNLEFRIENLEFKESIPNETILCNSVSSVVDPVPIVYCGNLGNMHDIETLVTFLKEYPMMRSFAFDFYASGPRLQELKKETEGDSRVSFHNALADDEWIEMMGNTPLSLVTLRSGAENVAMPSKAYSALAAGQAIIAICPKESDLAKLVVSNEVGWVIEPHDVERLSEVIKQIVDNPELLTEKRGNAWHVAREKYSLHKIAQKWMNLLEL